MATAVTPIKPISILIYGRSKIGKSTQFIRAFGPKALYICCEQGAIWPGTNPELNPWRDSKDRIILPRNIAEGGNGAFGQSLDYIEALSTSDPWGEVNEIVEKILLPGIASGRYAACVLDGLTEWSERIWAIISKSINSKENAHGKGFSNNLYPKVKGVIRQIIEGGCWFGAVSHEKEPSDFEGRHKMGCPNLMGDLGPSTPAFFDMVLRASVDTLPGMKKRDRIFICDSLDPDWVTGERFGVCAPKEAADLKGLLKRVAARQRGEEVIIPVQEIVKPAAADI